MQMIRWNYSITLDLVHPGAVGGQKHKLFKQTLEEKHISVVTFLILKIQFNTSVSKYIWIRNKTSANVTIKPLFL